MSRRSNYDKFPFVASGTSGECATGWEAIAPLLAGASVVCVECYPGADTIEVAAELARCLQPTTLFLAADAYKSADEIRAMLTPHLGSDRVFGRMNGLTLDDWFDTDASDHMRTNIAAAAARGAVLVVGSGAALLTPQRDVLVYADMARWEIQLRYRRFEAGNLGCDNNEASFAEKYKCGFFAEWRAADRLKKTLLPSLDFLLDTNDALHPKMISGDAFARGPRKCCRGGPFAWCLSSIPGRGADSGWSGFAICPKTRPTTAGALTACPRRTACCSASAMCGRDPVASTSCSISRARCSARRFMRVSATEFPIRFDFLDTIGGGNLSLPGHPLTEYIQDALRHALHAGRELLHPRCRRRARRVYLGLKEGIDRAAMLARSAAGARPAARPSRPRNTSTASRRESTTTSSSPPARCIARGADSDGAGDQRHALHLHLQAVGLGSPRAGRQARAPSTCDHGAANIQWDRTTEWVERNLVNASSRSAPATAGARSAPACTRREFIETRRHWFTEHGAARHARAASTC